MRVLHFFKTYAPDSFGGMQSVIATIARSTAPFGIETEVLSLSAEPERNTVFIDGHWARKARLELDVASTGLSLSALGAFARLARQADLVHYHFPWPMMDVAHFATRIDRPSVLTYHSDIVRQRLLLTLYRPLMHRFLDAVTAIVATSPEYLASSPVLQRYRDKVSIIPIGAHDARVPPPDPARLAFWRDRLPPRFFAFVGALRYYKGLDFLLDAAERTGYPVAIVGRGELSETLARAVRQRKLTQVHLLGELSEADKAIVLGLCYGFAFPSHLRSEAFGVALLEAAQFARPLISCELATGTSYVNRDGETGIVVPRADPAALAGAMQRLWDDPALAARFGAAARERYEKLFTAEAMGAAYAGLYRRLVAEAPLPA